MKDYVGEMWDDIKPHIEDELRMESEMKQFFLIVLAMILLACGNYGVYGLNEPEPEPSWLTDKLEEDLPSVADWSAEEEELDISDEDVAQVWGDVQVVFPVLMEDALCHTIDSPFCDDPGCPCHQDEALFQEYIERPVKDGAMKIWEAQALLWPER